MFDLLFELFLCGHHVYEAIEKGRFYESTSTS